MEVDLTAFRLFHPSSSFTEEQILLASALCKTKRSNQKTYKKVKFLQNLGILISFCLLPQQNGPENIKLFTIRTNHETITVKVGARIEILNSQTQKILSDQESLKTNKWYRLICNLSNSDTKIYLDDDEVINGKGFMKKQKDRAILQYSFGQQLFGFIGNIFIEDKTFQIQRLKDIEKGVTQWKQIQSLISEKDSILMSCLPFSVYQMKQLSFCYDIFKRNQSSIGQNIIVFHDYTEKNVISYLGGYQPILPLFYIARFYSKQIYPNHLENLLKLLLLVLEKYRLNEKNEIFLMILGNHMDLIWHLYTIHSITLLSQIDQYLEESNKILFNRYIIWNSSISKINDISLITAYFNLIAKRYQNNKSQSLRSFSLMDIIFWAIKNLQNSKSYCCLNHYICECLILQQFSFTEVEIIESMSHQLHYSFVQNIASVVLEYYIIDDESNAVKEVRHLLRLMLHKYSACLYFTLLKIIKRQTAKFKTDKQLAHILNLAQIQSFLSALAQKTVDFATISIIVYLLLYVNQYSKQSGKQDVINFIVALFKRLRDLFKQKFNFLKHGVSKLRKKSANLDQNYINQDKKKYESIQKIRKMNNNFSQLKIILLNFLVGVVYDLELSSSHSKFVSQESFELLFHFVCLADIQTHNSILNFINLKISEYPKNIQFCSKSIFFNKIILHFIRETNLNEKNFCIAKEIIGQVIRGLIEYNGHLGHYYILIKTLSRSQVDLSPFFAVLAKQIESKDIGLDHLSQVLSFYSYEQNHNHFQLSFKIGLLITNLIYRQIDAKYLTTSKISKVVITQFGQGCNGKSIFGYFMKLVSTRSQECVLFDEQLTNMPQEEVTFLFDIILPKIVAHTDISHILAEFKKKIYLLEIYLYQIFQLANKITSEIQLGQLAKNLTHILIIYSSICVAKKEQNYQKSFMRMILVLASEFFLFKISEYSLKQNADQIIESFKSAFATLWKFIITFIQQYARQSRKSSYEELCQYLQSNNIQPYFVQIFQVFLRNSQDDYLIAYQKLISLNENEIYAFIFSQEFKNLIAHPKIKQVYNACLKNCYSEIQNQYSQLILAQQNKIDSNTYKKQNAFKNIQNIFDTENIAEEEMRLKYLHEHEMAIRKYHSRWEKIWKNLRIYNHPYGLWMAQKLKVNYFLPDEKQIVFKNFALKMSKYSSKGGIQPILQSKIIEPWHVRKNIRNNNNKQLSGLIEMMKPNPGSRKKITQNKIMSHLTSIWGNLIKKNIRKQETNEYQVLWIKSGKKAKGKILINDNDEIVFWYESLKQEDSHLSFEKFHLPFNKQLTKSWRIDNIQKIYLRRYLMKYQALQLTMSNTKSLLFYFQQNYKDIFLNQINKIRLLKNQTYGSKIKLNRIKFYAQNDWYIFNGLEQQIIQNWKTRKISTLQYLIAVNKSASRGIYDISQYPVFPWVCQMTSQKQPLLRDLTKTMGGLGSQQRKKIIKQKYSSKDPFNPVPAFFFGTHYSSPGVIFNFLIRLSPFTEYCKNLQGGKFDIPDRLFSSFPNSWKSAFSEVSDVRELIPEFYYLPECLINFERHHFGATQSGEIIDNVELPPWAANNPYFFTTQMRQILESDDVGKFINQWIDLIFGFKQKGIQAQLNYNVYYYLTYQDYSASIQESNDDVYKKSCQAQIMHFGQIPPQIFDKPHIQRSLAFNLLELNVKEKVQLKNRIEQRLLGIVKINNQITLYKRNEAILISTLKTPAEMKQTQKIDLQISIRKLFHILKKEQARLINFRNYILVHGYLTNEFRIYEKAKYSIQYHESVESNINFLLVNEDSNLILIGCQSGMLHVYEIQYQGQYQLKVKLVHQEIMTFPIVHISQYDGFYVISYGNYISIYKIQRSLYYLSKSVVKPMVKFFRSFRNILPVKSAFIAKSPLYCLLIHDNAYLRVFSINGQLLKSHGCATRSVYRLKDKDLNDLFYYLQDDRLVLISTPDLRCISELQIKDAVQIFDKIVVFDREIWFIDCN